MPGYKWPDSVVTIIVGFQIVISLLLLVYFLTIQGTCTAEHCESLRLVHLPYVHEEQFVRRFGTERSIYLFYNVFVPSAYMYLGTTALMLLAVVFRFREFIAFGRKTLFIGLLSIYLAFLASTLLFPNSYLTSTQVQRGSQAGETLEYLIFFCLFPLVGLFFATAFSWKKYNTR
jgi:hypothetical protein